MAYNGDGPHNKRQRTDGETGNHRVHDGGAASGGGAAAAGYRSSGGGVGGPGGPGGGGYAGQQPQQTGGGGSLVGGGPGGGPGDEPRRKRKDDSIPNHVLLFTIINPLYPITVEVLHTICQASGQILRIVIFKKNGVQAMVEFDSIESAARAKESLNGADIYSGCCTLKIDFAKPDKLNVHKNDADSWDYTTSMFKEGNTNGRPQPLLQEPHYGSRPQPYSGYPSEQRYEYDPAGSGPGGYGDPYGPAAGGGGGGGGGGGDPGGYRGSLKGAPPPPPVGALEFRDSRGSTAGSAVATAAGYMAHHQQQGAVLMVYGLDPLRTNTDKLFNLMCLYGNVARIKFLKTKEGTAMVQMSDNVAVERCVQNLNNVLVSPTGACPKMPQDGTGGPQGVDGTPEHKLQLAFSKQLYLSEVTNPYPLPDKSPSYKEYITNKNNRFMNPTMASKNRIQPPSKILHFFNTPPHVTEQELTSVFREYDVAPPKAVKLFPMKSERSSSGLLEFETASEAVAAIMACNHAAIESPGAKFPFIMKLCFSSSRNMSLRNSYNNGNGSDKMNLDQEH